MFQLYGFVGSASLAPRMVLEELHLPYQFIRLDSEKGEHRSAEYLKLNPNGRVPTLIDGDQVLYEAAAICLHLCDQRPNAHLVPAIGHKARGHFYPDRLSTDPADAAAIKARAELNAQQIYQQIDNELAGQGPYLLGAEFSLIDLYLLMLVRWGRWFAEPPVRKYPHLAKLVQLLSERAAVQKTFAAEGIPAPYCLLPAA
jgi:glutathione S-transferase